MPLTLSRRRLLTTGAAIPLATPAIVANAAVAGGPAVRIGVLTALSGEYTDAAGYGSVEGTKMAVEDFIAEYKPGFTIEVVPGDMLDKPDIGITLARTWYDQDGIDMIVDMPNSAVALGVATVTREKNKVAMFVSAGADKLTGSACSPNHLQWLYDTWSIPHVTTTAVIADGGDSWFFITADYAYGHAMVDSCTTFIKAGGGKVLGDRAFPFPDTSDFSFYLLQGQASGAKILALAMSGGNLINCIKQAHEFGITRSGQRIVGLGILMTTLHALELETAQGLVYADPFYWDLNDGTRAFSKRFAPRYRKMMPTMLHAGCYSATLHYLKAVAAMGVDKAKADGAAAVAQMKAIPPRDPLFSNASIRPDGRKIHDMFLYQVKTPAESRYAWDYCNVRRTIPAAEAFRPIAEGGCKMV
ncbi:MAG: ABC transporter substrate-binding protein [Rhodopila sp.]|nr:ABC transporter substrate-binding protein [Rhodopila sp.]